jgi:predicted RNA-binding Zn ribbon-like protein
MSLNMPTKVICRRRPPRFELCAGMLCLDFVNTLDNRPSGQPKELLKSYVDLARFGEDTGILTLPQVEDLFVLSESAPGPAGQALRGAIALREAIHDVLTSIVHKRPVPAMALTTINGYVQVSAQHSRLVQGKAGFEWRFDESSSLDAVLWPIARSAADLLASESLPLVRACSSKTCQWLFLDTSKSHRRRWCDMKLCGNRAKARKFHAQQKMTERN